MAYFVSLGGQFTIKQHQLNAIACTVKGKYSVYF